MEATLCCLVNGVYKCGLCKTPHCQMHLAEQYAHAIKPAGPSCRECSREGVWVNLIDYEMGKRQQARIDKMWRV